MNRKMKIYTKITNVIPQRNSASRQKRVHRNTAIVKFSDSHRRHQ
jgi:hypothetical protein